jgi:hypothetical protein
MTHPAATDLSRFFEWRQNARAQDERSCRAEFWLFTHVAVVLFAGKAGELLTLDLHELEMTEMKPNQWLFVAAMIGSLTFGS